MQKNSILRFFIYFCNRNPERFRIFVGTKAKINVMKPNVKLNLLKTIV